jgi:translation initiation factor 3 subunit G
VVLLAAAPCACTQVAQERRNWARFGEAAKEVAGDSVTVQVRDQLAESHSCGHLNLEAQLAPRTRTQVVEDIPFERVRQQKATQQEKKQASMDFQAAMQTNDKQAVSGSIKDILKKKRMERELLRAKGLLKEAEKPPEEVCACVGPIVLAL